jgi:hypothetical protein
MEWRQWRQRGSCWLSVGGFLLVVNVKAVEGDCIHEEWRMSVGVCGWLISYTTSACAIFLLLLCLTVVLASERGCKGGEGGPLEQ